MNTYQVSYFPQGFAAAQTIVVNATEFMFNDLYVLFFDMSKTIVLAVPLALDPVITRTAAP